MDVLMCHGVAYKHIVGLANILRLTTSYFYDVYLVLGIYLLKCNICYTYKTLRYQKEPHFQTPLSLAAIVSTTDLISNICIEH